MFPLVYLVDSSKSNFYGGCTLAVLPEQIIADDGHQTLSNLRPEWSERTLASNTVEWLVSHNPCDRRGVYTGFIFDILHGVT